MGVAKNLLLVLLLCHLFIIHEARSKCPKSYTCRNFTLEFPFTNSSHPDCGLFVVHKCDSELEHPAYLRGARDTSLYLIMGKPSSNKFLIHDTTLQLFLELPQCVTFTNFSLLHSPSVASVALTFSPNITFFTCRNETPNHDVQGYFQTYLRKDCQASTVYYKIPATHHHAPAIPGNCSLNQLPMKPDEKSTDLLQLLTPNFTLEWNVYQQCYDCHNGGGQCSSGSRREFYCRTVEFYSSPGCGLITVDGCDSAGSPKNISGHQLNILEKIDPNKFLVQDNTLEGFLEGKSCLFIRNLTVPQIYPLSFTYSPNITLFSCFNRSSNDRIQDYFANYNSLNSSKRNGCQTEFSTIYYNINRTAGAEESDVPTECSMIQLPVSVTSDADSDDLLSMLTSNYTLEWNVPEGCRRSESGNEYACGKDKNRWKLIIAICIPIAAVLLFLLAFFIFWQRKKRLGRAYLLSRNLSSDPSSKSNIWGNHAKAKDGYEKDIELFLNNNGNLAPIRYKYSTIKKITNSFGENLGRGGFGSVYKGQLLDGHPVAVKVLNESNGNGEDFMNEVSSISRTSHINIVTLLGICFEGSKRALIYNFMPNGSLEKFIGNTVESGLGWDKLFEIALGIARGLEYLHQGCNTRILHLDIKPQNILLDKDLNPRISDFGLAKLCPNRSSIVSMMVARGTIGYIAPEVFSRNFGDVSYKSDVYSYGMLVLEMVGGRRTVDRREVDRTSEIYFPHYIYKELEEDAHRDSDFVGTVDEDETQVVKRNLMIIGLWCVQTNPKDRPSMTKVIEMLEGKLGTLEVPPKPYLYSPPRSVPTFSNSESF